MHRWRKDGHKRCVLDGASASTGPFSAGCAMGGAVVCRCSTALRPSICTKIFNALADGLEWIAKEHGVERFITRGAANSDECKLNLQMLLDVYNHLGLPIPQEKVEGLSTHIFFWAYSLTQSKVNFDSRRVSW